MHISAKSNLKIKEQINHIKQDDKNVTIEIKIR